MANRPPPYHNPPARAWRTAPGESAVAFHRSFPGYRPTRLVEAPALARELGVAAVHVKEEAARFGLPAFKMLGASYAICRALCVRYADSDQPLTLQELRPLVGSREPVELIAATDGNHGRAVARTARLLGLASRIFYPGDVSAEAKAAIVAEATVAVELDLPYDAVVAAARAAASAAGDGALIVQDTSWHGYELIPRSIVAGYSTLFHEADEVLPQPPDLVVVPTGVGSLLQAAVQHYRGDPGEAGTEKAGSQKAGSQKAGPEEAGPEEAGRGGAGIVAVEPHSAAPILASLHAGRSVTVETSPTVMAGLNCGTTSPLAWPLIHAGVDRAISVGDEEAARAVGDLAAYGIDAGPCGAASLAGIRALARHERLDPTARVLLVSTEGRAANPVPERLR